MEAVIIKSGWGRGMNDFLNPKSKSLYKPLADGNFLRPLLEVVETFHNPSFKQKHFQLAFRI